MWSWHDGLLLTFVKLRSSQADKQCVCDGQADNFSFLLIKIRFLRAYSLQAVFLLKCHDKILTIQWKSLNPCSLVILRVGQDGVSFGLVNVESSMQQGHCKSLECVLAEASAASTYFSSLMKQKGLVNVNLVLLFQSVPNEVFTPRPQLSLSCTLTLTPHLPVRSYEGQMSKRIYSFLLLLFTLDHFSTALRNYWFN